MTGRHNRAAIYLRVSRDDQTTENQRLVLARVAEHRGWIIVQTYEDQGISGAKGRDQRPAFDQMLKDAVRRRFDVLMVWSIDRLGRSVLHVANALAELDAAGVALYSDQQAIDSTTPMGRAMIQMASVFGEQERDIIRSRVNAGLDRVRAQGKKLGRPKVLAKIEAAIREHLSAGHGILKVAAMVGCRQRHRAAGEEGDGGSVGGRCVKEAHVAMWPIMVLTMVILIAACERSRPPSFMGRVQEDCTNGDQWACDLLTSFSKAAQARQ